MNVTRLSSSSKIILGLSLQKDELKTIKSAASLAKKTGAEVILAHCLMPFYNFTYIGDGSIYPVANYEDVLNQMDANSAKEKLARIKDEYFSEIPCETAVSRAYAADGIMNIAKEHRADLIIIAADLEDIGSLSGISTSITLMKRSPIPLLVIPSSQTINFSCDTKAIIADNLSEDAQPFLAVAYGFLRSIQSKEVIQLHAKEVSEFELRRLIENIKTAMILNKIPNEDDNISEVILKERIQTQALQKMQTNCRQFLSPFEAKNIQFEVSFGNPAQDIKELVKRLEANLIIFGRHHFFHRDTFSLGRVPWKSMLENKTAILVVNT